MLRKVLTYAMLLMLTVSQESVAQTKVWLLDGAIINALEVEYDSVENVYTVYRKKKTVTLDKCEIFAITTPFDTTIVNDTILTGNYTIDFLQGYHDGLKRLNPNVFIPSVYLSIFSNFLLIRYSCAIRNLPNFAAFVISTINTSDSLSTLSCPEEAYNLGFKLGQEQRRPLDVALGTIVGSYTSMAIAYFIFER